MPNLLKLEWLRFTLVAVLGLVVDVSVAWSFAAIIGTPLVLAAAIGFAVGAGCNYVCHELWTFRSGRRQLSIRRAALYLASLGFTLATRLAMVAILEWLLPGPGQDLAILLLATVVSFCVSYVTGKFLVFRSSSSDHAENTPETKG